MSLPRQAARSRIGLVHLGRVQGADANAVPINEKRVAVDRFSLTLDD